MDIRLKGEVCNDFPNVVSGSSANKQLFLLPTGIDAALP